MFIRSALIAMIMVSFVFSTDVEAQLFRFGRNFIAPNRFVAPQQQQLRFRPDFDAAAYQYNQPPRAATFVPSQRSAAIQQAPNPAFRQANNPGFRQAPNPVTRQQSFTVQAPATVTQRQVVTLTYRDPNTGRSFQRQYLLQDGSQERQPNAVAAQRAAPVAQRAPAVVQQPLVAQRPPAFVQQRAPAVVQRAPAYVQRAPAYIQRAPAYVQRSVPFVQRTAPFVQRTAPVIVNAPRIAPVQSSPVVSQASPIGVAKQPATVAGVSQTSFDDPVDVDSEEFSVFDAGGSVEAPGENPATTSVVESELPVLEIQTSGDSDPGTLEFDLPALEGQGN